MLGLGLGIENDMMELLNEGYRLQRLGRTAEAERIYREILTKDGDSVHALNLLGALCVNSGRYREALPLIEQAVALEPNDPDARANLGLALKGTGNLEEAAEQFARAVQLAPDGAVTLNNLGNVLAALGRPTDAIAMHRKALRIMPDYVECLNNLAMSLLVVGQVVGALEASERAIYLRPSLAEAHVNRGEALRKLARYEDAIKSFRNAVKLKPEDSAALIGLSSALKEVGDVAEARVLLEQLLSRDPHDAHAHSSLGALLEQLGDPGGAAGCFRSAIICAPRYAQAYQQLAHLDGCLLTDLEVAAAEELLEKSMTCDDDRALILFALGSVYEARGDVDRSFAYWQRAQSIKGRKTPYDDRSVGAHYDAIKRAFSEVMLAPRAVSGTGTSPVFVLGMPRSGTSLTEQILATHQRIVGAGELSLMEDTITEACRISGVSFPTCCRHLGDEQRRHLGDFYLTRLVKRAGPGDYIVDKTPMNFQYIGFIASILPQAKFVHCTRNPVDNCLSIYKLPFEDGQAYAHDLTALGQFYCKYANLMAHWKRVLPGRVCDVRYEEMVADIGLETKRLLDFLELPFDPAVLQFHRTKRLVTTPSASQVRRPIYASSVEYWHKYAAHLTPLLEALGRQSM